MGQSNKEIRTKGGFVPEVGQVMDGDLPEASMGSNCSLGSAKGSSSQPRIAFLNFVHRRCLVEGQIPVLLSLDDNKGFKVEICLQRLKVHFQSKNLARRLKSFYEKLGLC